MLVSQSLDRFATKVELPFEPTLELSENEVEHIHGYIEDVIDEEGEPPSIDRIMYVYSCHPELEDEVENILRKYDGGIQK